MTCLTRERTDEGFIVRRYVNDRLEAERGPGYSLGTPKVTDDEYMAACPSQAGFLELVNGGHK